VIYPGSIERTSFAELDEEKGYVVVEVAPGGVPGGALGAWTFHRLPVRPMVIANVAGGGADRSHLERLVAEAIGRAPPDAVVQIRVHGLPDAGALTALRAATLRALAPATMNVEITMPDLRRPRW
jgi:DNA repair exonuclease SbcCD nuclease subunit